MTWPIRAAGPRAIWPGGQSRVMIWRPDGTKRRIETVSPDRIASSSVMSQQFWKFREASVVYQLPDVARRYIGGQTGSNIVFGMRNMHTWTSFSGIDPEANYGLTQNDIQNEFNTAPLPLYFTLRLNLTY